MPSPAHVLASKLHEKTPTPASAVITVTKHLFDFIDSILAPLTCLATASWQSQDQIVKNPKNSEFSPKYLEGMPWRVNPSLKKPWTVTFILTAAAPPRPKGNDLAVAT